MTEEQLAQGTARLEQIERREILSYVHEDSLRMLRSWWQDVKRCERNKIVDINEYRYWRRLT